MEDRQDRSVVDIAVVAALREEVAPLLGKLDGGRVERLAGVRARVGSLGGVRLVVMVTGDGRHSAAAGVEALFESYQPSLLVGVGVAGGLSPELLPGDVVVAERVLDGGDAVPAPDAEWLSRALSSGGTRSGTVVSVENIVARASAKTRLWQSVGSPVPAVVDLESAVWAREAASNACPYLVLRAVSDGPGEDLPVDFNLLRDQRGRVSRMRVVQQVLSKPALASALLELRSRVKLCASALTEQVEELTPR